MKNIFVRGAAVYAAGLVLYGGTVPVSFAAYHFSEYAARPPIHVYGSASATPAGLTPAQVKVAYRLPVSGGHGTIALIGAYHQAAIQNDLAVFNKQFALPACTIANGCFEQHMMASSTKSDAGWDMETALDVEWAHAIAPAAKILLIEAPTPSATNLLKAIDYARARPDVVAISMSWGGAEFSEETTLDYHFVSHSGAAFFAASGDDGWGPSWPAASPNVISVGGTHLTFSDRAAFLSETAWPGSGGGVSAYEKQPLYQADYAIPRAGGMRAIPDVAYNADPKTGFSVYHATLTQAARGAAGKTIKGWYRVGGTSAGAPQWAAIHSLGLSAFANNLYVDKTLNSHAYYFRDIVSGSNGSCAYYCAARKHYDYVTGLGTPLTINF